MGAGSGLLSMMAARYKHATNPPFCVTKKKKKTTQAVISKINREKH